LLNGTIVTVDKAFSLAQAVAIAAGRFVAVGSDAAVRPLIGAETTVIDLAGRTVVPGFIDTHGHIGLFGLETHWVSLAGARSLVEIQQRIATRVRKTPPGQWIITLPVGDPPFFFNVPAVLQEKRFPTRWDLDAVAPAHPVYITAPTNRVPNSAVLNSVALRLAGITRETPQPDGIEIVKDAATGEPTGELRGAMQPIYNKNPFFVKLARLLPRPTYEDIRDGIRQLAPSFLAGGTTTLLEAHLNSPEELRAYAELLARDELPLRVFYTFEIDPRKSLNEIAEHLRTVSFAAGRGFGTARLKVVGVSIGLDGPHWHGAAVAGEPYLGPFGKLVNPEPLVPWDTYVEILRMAARLGLRIHAEAAGRGAIEMVLSALRAVNTEIPIREKRFVIEHVEFPTPAQIADCRRLGLIPTTATNFVWGKGAEVYQARLGAEYAQQAIPLRAWLDGGVPVAQSTDWGPREALFTLWQSMARQAGLTGEVVGPEQRISREEALRLFTNNGAYALWMEDELGSIEVGKLADLVVLSQNPLTCPEDEIRAITVESTMVDGNIVYQKP
jgi:predicted amidohydrolase YtcJ